MKNVSAFNNILLFTAVFNFLFVLSVFAATENLEEKINRKARYSSATRPVSLLENSLNFYVWQPELLIYTDSTSSRETGVLIQGPDEWTIYSKEYSTDAWSFDGSILGVWIRSSARPTSNPNSSTTSIDYRRWLVRSDGSKLKSAEGYAHNDIADGGFGWANTENAYYGFGAGRLPANSWDLAKNSVNGENIVLGSILLNTKTAAGGDDAKIAGSIGAKKGLVKRALSTDDKWITASARLTSNYGLFMPCTGNMRISLGNAPYIKDYWGIARQLYQYGDHLQTNEATAHGGTHWAMGFSNEKTHISYSGAEHTFWEMSTTGTATDGGPKWEKWDGNSWGGNEITPISFGRGRIPAPEGRYNGYWNHPAFDRWSKYILTSRGDADPGGPGTTVYQFNNGDALGSGFDGLYGAVGSGISSKAQYDGYHHAWGGWTDTVVFFPAYIDNISNGNNIMYAQHLDFKNKTSGTPYPIATTHNATGNPYEALPRPSQSPDGTKVAYAAYWLNSSSSYPYLQYAVAYYPYPPEIKSVTKNGGNVRLTWDFNQGIISSPNYTTPRTYTKRGWPNESNDLPPSPREIKQFRVWNSVDNLSWIPLGLVTYNNRSGKWTETAWIYDAMQSVNSTRYYALTSLEHSGLESRTLSNTWKVSLDADGNVIQQVQQSAYPANPGGKTTFYSTKPVSPTEVVSAYKLAPAIADGQYTITWRAPSNNSLIRYYNIYAADGSVPATSQQQRIASIPATSDYTGSGSYKYIDWLGAPTGTTKYVVTSVDFQGNESAVGWSKPPVLELVPKTSTSPVVN